ncbi:hypothetical protein H5410_005160 [Solanum commersonii]|uniref:Uncharacterized protein n=1 Tax=Solanum commersonii TaxID=4109 RepID=A0A9J6A5M9_SOLCO|nr:hypothetical protein H5410_005160 [Solanum commersonii]
MNDQKDFGFVSHDDGRGNFLFINLVLDLKILLLSKEDPMMVKVLEVITMVVVVDIDVEVGAMVVLKMVRVVAGGMEVMVDVTTVV